ncbi:TrbI/VirB10 family protein [Phormidium sp. FACHB-1136]|uniref:TrbI/VirB10 family protein n=1 Tax=Phormidium sp. FACHB-1136 TaxID=2692848 RepID=UPI0016879836|nr:TrbI/VirB10 family protein [Phormidium sp. FACHB-1136]MBD2425544.1 TrbI/VirB10 family protein [Phormidium sp. FACHB-1136]
MTTPNNPWDDQAMADLVGLHSPAPTLDSEQAEVVPPPDPPLDGEPLLDREDMEQPAVGVGQPRLSLAANPFTKLGVVAAGTGLVIGALAVFTSGVMSGGDVPTEETRQADFPEPMVTEPEVSATDDRGQLLTDLAMGRQQAELEALTREEPPDQEVPAVQEISAPAPSPPPRPPQPIAARPIPAPPPPRPTPAPSVVAPRPAMPPPMARPAAATVDPTEQWLALSQLGSYGQSLALPQTVAAPASSSRTAEAQIAIEDPSPIATPVAQRLTPPPIPSPSRDINHAEESAILQELPIAAASPLPLLTGTQAPAVLETPLIWAAETDSPQVIVQLTEPLLTAAGEVGLPAETPLVVQVEAVADSGLAQLAVVSFIQSGQEIPLSADTLHLRGVEGTPLMAQKYDDPGRDIARMDATMAAMAGLSRAAALVNRPRTSSVVTSAGGSAITQDTGEANLLAGVLEGAFEQVSGQMATRNQAALDEILNRPVVWYLPPGTEVEVYVNQTVAL